MENTVFKPQACRARIDAPSTLHHIVIRGIEGKAIFKDANGLPAWKNKDGKTLKELESE
ncbi:MAG: hypothetical protein WCA42_05765 [Desulfobacterales bacterium]